MPAISAIFLSLVGAALLAIPAILAQFAKKQEDVPLLVDVKTFWGHPLTKGEVFWFGLLIHLLVATLFGALYYLVVASGIMRAYQLGDLLVYASVFFIFVGSVIFPSAGLGFFGRKEGKFVWLELLIVHHLLALIIWGLVKLFPVLKP